MKLKNYMKEGQKLPLFGIGPYLIEIDLKDYKKQILFFEDHQAELLVRLREYLRKQYDELLQTDL